MPKRFTLIDCLDKQVVVSGFQEPDTLHKVSEIVDLLTMIPNTTSVELSIIHLIYLDHQGVSVEDATAREVEILQAKLPELFDLGCIEEVEEIVLEVEGLSEIDNEAIVEVMV